jgi:hypothetical protein
MVMMMNEMSISQIQKYLKQLTPQTRGRLLVEIERLQLCGDETSEFDLVLAELRAEFRETGWARSRVGNPSRYFFQPLEPVLVNRSPERANRGEISRGSLAPIWEWISQNLLPTMAREYAAMMKVNLAANDMHGVQQIAVAFQAKVAKYLETTLASSDGEGRICSDLAGYTSSRATFHDLTKILCFLRARDALADFNDALPPKIDAFEDKQLAKVKGMLDDLKVKHADASFFALTMVRKRLETPWQLIRLATKFAKSKDVIDVAASSYAIAVPMVLDHLDDRRMALRDALKSDQIAATKNILTYIYDCEYALRVRINRLDESEWGKQLADVMQAVTFLIESDLRNFPKGIKSILQSRTLHNHDSFAGRLTYLAWKGRDVLSDGATYCKKLVTQTRKSSN